MNFDSTACLANARKLLAQGPLDDSLLQFLRDQGATMLDSVNLIRALRPLSLREAQDLVHNSPVWADHHESHQQLQDDFVDALLALGGKLEDA